MYIAFLCVCKYVQSLHALQISKDVLWSQNSPLCLPPAKKNGHNKFGINPYHARWQVKIFQHFQKN